MSPFTLGLVIPLLVACGSAGSDSSSTPMLPNAASDGGAAISRAGAPSGGAAGQAANSSGAPAISGAAGGNSEVAVAGEAGLGAASSAAGAGGQAGSGEAGSGGRAGSTSSQAGSGSAGSGGAAPTAALTVYLAGDSTVSQYVLDPKNPKSWAGWGQMLAPNYNAKVTVKDEAVGGRTARRFIQEGHLAAILDAIKAGDYLLVQFGTNDSNPTATYTLNGASYPYFADAQTDFKTYLQQYIDGAQAKHAVVALVTPPPRNSAYCNGPRSLANYGQAMIELGTKDNVPVLDLGAKTHAYLQAICPKPSSVTQETFFKVDGGSIDGTHFQENGARIMAGFVADAIDEQMLSLASYRLR